MSEVNVKAKNFLDNPYIKFKRTKLNNFLEQVDLILALVDDNSLTFEEKLQKDNILKIIDNIYMYQNLEDQYNSSLIDYLLLLEKDTDEEKKDLYFKYMLAKETLVKWQNNVKLLS